MTSVYALPRQRKSAPEHISTETFPPPEPPQINYLTWVRDLIARRDLGDKEKLQAILLSTYAAGTRLAIVGDATVAEALAEHRSTVNSRTHRLQSAGVLRTIRRGRQGKRNLTSAKAFPWHDCFAADSVTKGQHQQADTDVAPDSNISRPTDVASKGQQESKAFFPKKRKQQQDPPPQSAAALADEAPEHPPADVTRAAAALQAHCVGVVSPAIGARALSAADGDAELVEFWSAERTRAKSSPMGHAGGVLDIFGRDVWTTRATLRDRRRAEQQAQAAYAEQMARQTAEFAAAAAAQAEQDSRAMGYPGQTPPATTSDAAASDRPAAGGRERGRPTPESDVEADAQLLHDQIGRLLSKRRTPETLVAMLRAHMERRDRTIPLKTQYMYGIQGDLVSVWCPEWIALEARKTAKIAS